MCWVRQRDLGTEHMALFVNSNLALELPADVDRPSTSAGKRPDPRAELAAQFIPAGARVLDLGASSALRTLLPNGCSYVGRLDGCSPLPLSLCRRATREAEGRDRDEVEK